MSKLREMSGTLNVNAYEDKGKYAEDTTSIEILSGEAELIDEEYGNRPDLRGKCLINGETYFISVWYNHEYDFFSMSFTSTVEKPSKQAKKVVKKGVKSSKK